MKNVTFDKTSPGSSHESYEESNVETTVSLCHPRDRRLSIVFSVRVAGTLLPEENFRLRSY